MEESGFLRRVFPGVQISQYGLKLVQRRRYMATSWHQYAWGVVQLTISVGIYYWIYSAFRKEHVKKYGEEETQRVVERDIGGNWIDFLRPIIVIGILASGIKYIMDLVII